MSKTQAQRAEEAVALYYKQGKATPLKDICVMLDCPLWLAMTILEEYNT